MRAEAMGVGLVRGENIEMGTLENNTTTHQVRVLSKKKKKWVKKGSWERIKKGEGLEESEEKAKSQTRKDSQERVSSQTAPDNIEKDGQ